MTRSVAFRLSLLLGMGIVPLACSSESIPRSGDGQGGAAAVNGVKPSTRCTNGKLDPVTGMLKCDEGYSVRSTATQCNAPPGPSKPRASGMIACETSQDCAAFDLGYCGGDEEYLSEGGASSYCQSGCRNDEDCGSGTCQCDGAETGGTCLPSHCKTNADCEAGFVCATYYEICGGGGLACTSAKDQCPNSECPASSCTYSSSLGYRICETGVCGRPFLVQAEARLAPVAQSAAWLERAITPRVVHLDATERARHAAHWTRLGQMEHASIAAFARFQLQLLALGAPASLVKACNQALIDETAHAQLCFALASAYAGHDVGPGALDVSHSLGFTSLADVVELVIAEGCAGETDAALQALEAADAASDPVIREAYSRIAADEQRHAALAFRFVRWALERDPQLESRVIAALSRLSPTPTTRDVVEPCLRALLAHRHRAPTMPLVLEAT